MKKTVSFVIFLAIGLALFSSNSMAIDVGNPDFEESGVAPGGWAYTTYPWVGVDMGGGYLPWISHGYYAEEPEPKTQVIYTEDNLVYQELSATFQEGGVYVYSIDICLWDGDDDWEIFLFDATAGQYSTYLASLKSTDPGQQTDDYLEFFRKSLSFLAPAEQAGNEIGIGITGGPWSFFDNITLEVPMGASMPDPFDGEVDVSINKTLSWQAGRDPNFPGLAEPAITAHELYMTTSSTDPNMNLVATIPVDGTAGQYDLPENLQLDTTYYWRVDEVTVAGVNTIPGDVWMFQTAQAVPVISQATPADILVGAGSSTTLTVVASNPITGSPEDVSLQWYKVGSPDQMLNDGSEYSGVQTSSLTLVDAQIADEGQYYCLVTNTAGNTASKNSRAATLAIKKMIAWWKFDETAGNVAADSSTYGANTPATVITSIANPDDVWNPNGISNGALDCDGSGTWADTGALAADLGIDGGKSKTVSAWVNTRGFNNGGIFDVGSRVAARDFSLRTLDSDNQWRIQYWGGDRDFVYPSKNTWVHFVLTHGPAGTKVYADGQMIVDWPGKTLDTGDGFTFRIGHYGPDNEKFNGLIDEVRLYNYALEALEVANLYIEIKPDETVCLSKPPMDFTGPDGVPDCIVDIYDFAEMASQWMQCNFLPDCN